MMKKISLFLILTIFVATAFSACINDNDELPDLKIHRDPPSSFYYGFMEECSNGFHRIRIESFEVVKGCEQIAGSFYESYYVILGVSTNMTQSDFSRQNNRVVLGLSPQEWLVLSFVSWDAEMGKLIYKIPVSETVDYPELLNLKISDSSQDYLYPCLDLKFYIFDRLITIGDTQYLGQIISLKLES